jgi:quercetin dioxygenase-like cupin family protein
VKLKFAAVSVSSMLLIGSLTGCSSSSEATPTATLTPPVVLLDKARSTILDQDLVYPSDTHAEVSSAVITLIPGQETGKHSHDAPLYAHILEGTLTVEYEGGVTKVYKKGQSIMEAIGTVHNGRNLSDETVKILVVNIGAEGVQNTIKVDF